MGQARQRGTREERITQAVGIAQAREEAHRKLRDTQLNPLLMKELQTLSELEGQTLIPEDQILAIPYEKRMHLYQTAWKANHGTQTIERTRRHSGILAVAAIGLLAINHV